MPMTTEDETPFDPTARRLCPDGACTGLLDAGNRCSACGKVWGPHDVPVFDMVTAAEPVADSPPEDAPSAVQEATDDGFDPHRRLCPDGACVGVIGENGRCSECGRSAATEELSS